MSIVQSTPPLPPITLTDSLLRENFSPKTLEAGRIYELRGRVRSIAGSPDGTTITAETIGSRPDPYKQRVRLARRPAGGIVIVGSCTCPMGHDCKHIAAVMVALKRKADECALRKNPLSPAPARPEARLPPPIDTWLTDLQRGIDDESEDYPDTIKNRILYTLTRDASRPGVPALSIQPFNATLRKDGRLSHIRQYPPHQVRNPARFLRPSDRIILARLDRSRYAYTLSKSEEDPVDTVRRILATGRAFWEEIDGPVMKEGPPRDGRITWELKPDGTQRAMLAVDKGLLPLQLPAPWYADPARGLMGPVNLELPTSLTAKLLSAPPIPAEVAARVRQELARRLPTIAVPGPNELPEPTPVAGPPKPHVRLMAGAMPRDPTFGRGAAYPDGSGLFISPILRLTYTYGPLTIPCSDQPQPTVFGVDGVLYKPERDEITEGRLIDRLGEVGMGRVSRLLPHFYRHAHSDDFTLVDADLEGEWLKFLVHEVPRLRAEGWTIEVDDNFPLSIVTPTGNFDAELVESSGIDWLELHLGVEIDGERIDIAPALAKLIAEPGIHARLAGADDDILTVPIEGRRRLALKLGKVRPTLLALLELFEGGVIHPDDGRIGFTRLDAAELAAMEDRTGLVWRGGEALRDLGRQLRESGGSIPHVAVPTCFRGSLRGYQSQGVDWLQFLRGTRLGGVLADDMGLGKTVQTLAHLMVEKQAGRMDRPALIVCPTSVVPNWAMEAERFAPELKVLALHGPARKARFREIGTHDVVLTSYPLLVRDHAVLTQQEWHVVVLDEAQTIKNPNAATTRQALCLKAHQRLCLSGTPLQNHLGELWSLFDFLAPGFLGSQKSFRSHFRLPIEKFGDADRGALLARRVRPFLLRRTKEEVAVELPPKTEISERVDLESGQRAVYEGIRLAMHARVKAAIASKGMAKSGIIILDALLKMRQACCDPSLLKMQSVARTKVGSSKLDRLMEMVPVMLAEGRRILLFSQFTEMLGLIEQRVRDAKIDYVMLTGDTKDRATPVRRFQNGEVPLFLISLKAGGVGLNLTAADTVIHYDPWWNPAVEDQATDRAHRIGQDKKVFVHRLVSVGTIEEKMEVLKEKKRTLVASIVEAERGAALRLTEADLEALFAPAA